MVWNQARTGFVSTIRRSTNADSGAADEPKPLKARQVATVRNPAPSVCGFERCYQRGLGRVIA